MNSRSNHNAAKGLAKPNQASIYTCNVCSQVAASECYKTKCLHLICEKCAYRQFNTSSDCPICRTDLRGPEAFSEIDFDTEMTGALKKKIHTLAIKFPTYVATALADATKVNVI